MVMNDRAYDLDQRRLLAAAQAGDERAFRRLVEPYRHALEVHCYRMLGSAQDAEDLAQETLLRAWRALERFEPRAQFQTWLIGSRRTRVSMSSSAGRADLSPSTRSRTALGTRRRHRRMTLLLVTRSGRGWSWRCCARSRSS